jgi:hypothetical protein
MARWTLGLLAAGAAVTLALELYLTGWSVRPFAGLLGFWPLVPYGVLALFLLGLDSPASLRAFFVGAFLIVVLGLAVYVYAFFIQTDAQSALAFLSVPTIQLLAACVVIVTAHLVG